MRTFTGMGMSRRNRLSISRKKIMPPSRMGNGNRLNMPRLTEMTAMVLINGIHPCAWAASCTTCAIPIGPERLGTEICRANMTFRTSQTDRDLFLLKTHDALSDLRKESLSTLTGGGTYWKRRR